MKSPDEIIRHFGLQPLHKIHLTREQIEEIQEDAIKSSSKAVFWNGFTIGAGCCLGLNILIAIIEYFNSVKSLYSLMNWPM